MIALTERNIGYLPQPNTVELVLTDELAPVDLTSTAFVMPMYRDGSFLLATNQSRGIEIPGGHIEPGETCAEAAAREAMEEVGAVVGDLTPIGFLRQTVDCERPEQYRYPFPVSYQQFFGGRIIKASDFIATEECAAPFICCDLNDRRIHRKTISIFGEAARRILL